MHGLKNEPAPSAQEKIIHGRIGGVGWGGGGFGGGDKTNRIGRDETITLVPPSEEVQIQQLLSVLSKSLKSGIRASQPASSLPAQIN